MLFLLKLLLSPKTMVGIAVGAAAVWFTDPERGPERRERALTMIKERAPGSVPAPSFGSTTQPTRPPTEPTLWTPEHPKPDTGTQAAAS